MLIWGVSVWLLAAGAAGAQTFTDVTTEVGFTAEVPAPGAAWGDYDGDGDLDLFVSDLFGPGQLYNSANGQFANITAEAGIGGEGSSSGIAWADYDNDGDLDLFVGNLFSASALYENQGNGLFIDRAERAGVQGQSGSLSVSWGDYNGDGHVDLFVGAISPEGNPPSRFYHNNGDGTFVDLLVQTGIQIYASAIAWGDYDNDGDLDLYMSNNHLSEGNTPNPNFYWRNDGDGAFVDVAEAAGVAGRDWSVGVAGGDMDNDGDLDLYVSTNGGPSRLYRNLGEGQFDEVGGSAGVADEKEVFEFSNAVAWVDYDADGYLDLFLGNDVVGPPNRLFRNQGAGEPRFVDVAPEVGLDYDVGWGAAWGDYDV